MHRHPGAATHSGFALIAVLCLTLGIASTTAVFSWVEGILLRPFPKVARQERMVAITGTDRNGRTDTSWCAAVNPAVQIDKPTFQPGLILLPSDTVHSWSGLTLQRVKAIPEQCDCQMVKQGGELPLLPFPCCPAHTRQPLGHANPALCRVRAELMSVLLDQRPSLLALRRRSPAFVRMIHRYCSAVRLLEDVHASRTALAFTRRPVATTNRFRRLRGLPVLVHGMSRRAWGLRLRRAGQQLAFTLPVVLPSAT